MSNSGSLYREVYHLTQELLCAHGMRRRKPGFFTRDLCEDVIGAIGLNTATKYGFDINPLVGVRQQSLERLLAEMKGKPFHPYVAPTISRPIGYLMDPPKFRQWSFEQGQDNAAVVADMVHQITTIGFAYMEANQTIEAMCDRIAKDRDYMMHSDIYQLPVGYLMLKRYDEAEQVVRRELDKIATHRKPTIEEHEAALGEKLDPQVIKRLEARKDEPIPAHENYRRFAKAFFEKLEAARRGVDPLA